ncbi:hypothetical protein GCM10027048_28140 [Hymenobacter coalescens]
MNTAEIIILCITGCSLLIMANQHGKPKEGKNNFWASLIANAITLGLLYWAGLFH